MATACIAGIAEIRELIRRARLGGARIGCVPTMGSLHTGHTALFDRARADCDVLVATLFVNPLQFDRQDDLRSYPRDFDGDLEVCARHGVDLLFAPTPSEMYPQRPELTVEVPSLSSGLCGASRPGHFRGVATVVLKLLNIVQPDFACFGEKDFQQLAIIRRLAFDSNLPTEIVAVETVRESDGLAVSSRNRLLSAEQRAAAPALARALRAGSDAIAAGVRHVDRLRTIALDEIGREPLLSVDYIEFVDPDTLAGVDSVEGQVRIAGAVFVGDVRLIDNVPAFPPEAR